MKFADLFRMFQLIYDKNDEKLLSVKCSVCSTVYGFAYFKVEG